MCTSAETSPSPLLYSVSKRLKFVMLQRLGIILVIHKSLCLEQLTPIQQVHKKGFRLLEMFPLGNFL